MDILLNVLSKLLFRKIPCKCEYDIYVGEGRSAGHDTKDGSQEGCGLRTNFEVATKVENCYLQDHVYRSNVDIDDRGTPSTMYRLTSLPVN